MKQRAVVSAPAAARDLEAIYDLIADASSAFIAFGYELRLRAFCDGLDLASERGHRRDDVRPGLRIIGLERRVTIAFTVKEERVSILALFYGGVNWDGVL